MKREIKPKLSADCSAKGPSISTVTVGYARSLPLTAPMASLRCQCQCINIDNPEPESVRYLIRYSPAFHSLCRSMDIDLDHIGVQRCLSISMVEIGNLDCARSYNLPETQPAPRAVRPCAPSVRPLCEIEIEWEIEALRNRDSWSR